MRLPSIIVRQKIRTFAKKFKTTMSEVDLVKQQTITNLKSGNSFVIIETLRKLRDYGDVDYIPVLVDILNDKPNTEITKAIKNIFFDLKDKAAVPVIVKAILDEQNIAARPILVEACWQNGLNYGQHLSSFVKLMVECDFKTSFDAFTVIENMTDTIDCEAGQKQIDFLKDNLQGTTHDKKLLMVELIDIIKQRCA